MAPQAPVRDLSTAEIAYLLQWFGRGWRLNNRLLVVRLRGRDLFRRYWCLENWDLSRGEAMLSCYPERVLKRTFALKDIAFVGPASAPEFVSFALNLRPAAPSGV